jgi:putative transposase
MDALGEYPFCGYGVIMGKCVQPWQDIETVLSYFGKTIGPARRSDREFVTQGIDEGRRWDLTGGGLIRSTGGGQGAEKGKGSR